MLFTLAYASGQADRAGIIISLFASVTLLCLGLLSSTREASGEPESPVHDNVAADPAADPEVARDDRDILNRLEEFLKREQAFLDPNRTLLRLARRLHVAEKRLSAAVNRTTGDNVPRYVNAWRINHACKLIEAGQTVTEAMLDSGFSTKSNFNREFARLKGRSPTDWAKFAAGGAAVISPGRQEPTG